MTSVTEEMIEALKPCPFCGKAVELQGSKTLGDRLFVIACPEDSPCRGSGLGIYVIAGQVGEAIAAWNTRAALEAALSASPAAQTEAVAWRDETEMEHIARDIAEGRFPQRSERQKRPDVADAWERITSDPELAVARKKCSMHELRRIIAHAVAAEKELAAALASPVAQQRDEGWQDIATAPKNRKVLVGYHNPNGKWRTVTARYHTELPWSDDHDPEPDDGEFAPEGWYEESDSADTIYRTHCPPTHWRPLPQPPLLSPERKDK